MAYNYKIIIQQSTETRDDYGEVDTSWSTYKTVWAKRENTGGGMGYESDQPVYAADIVLKFRTKDAPDVTTKMRVSFQSKIYLIRSIQWDKMNTTLIGEAFDDE